jgi:outer membrane protein OmpA-like peptidoglycan-associated protein
MAGMVWKWLVPGAITVIAGTALAVTQTGAMVADDLSARAGAALDPGQFPWARLSVDGRDATITGTATTQAAIDRAVARVAEVNGIRAVNSSVTLAERMSPFVFSASVSGGKVALSGGYPDETLHAALVAAAGQPADSMKLASGAPGGFDTAAKFALGALGNLDEGHVALTDSTLTIEGRAKSAVGFDALQSLPNSAPAGLQVAALKVTPPLASPYIWTASFDGARVTISGDTPDPGLADKLRALAPAGVTVSTTLALASGEPADFAANTLALLKSLLQLEQGQASIDDGKITLSGAPASAMVAEAVTAAVEELGGTASLEPPRVADFALSVDKTDGALVFSGVVPDAATRNRLAALSGADAGKLTLARGAPQRFASALDFGLEVLGHLASGKATIDGDRLSLSGRAGTVADFRAATELVAQGAPQGVALAATELHPPVAKPFTFAARKADDGTVSLSGFVPDEAARATLEAKIANLAADTADPADGAPDNFVLSAGKGLDVLALLDSGTLAFDGANWSIDGNVDTPKKGFAADAAYSVAGLRTAGWSYSVHVPEPTLPIIAPYVWRAQKAADGSLAISGFVPSDDFKASLATRASNVSDTTALGAGAPADFDASAAAGLDALLALDDGTLNLAGSKWTLTGSVADAKARDTIQAALNARINPANWQVAIQAKDSAPVAAPYVWSAMRAADGSVEFTGYLPSETLKSFAAARAGAVSSDATAIASGEPAGFSEDLLAGLDALSHLTEGRAAFDGSAWHLSGSVASAAEGDAALAALKAGSRDGALWTTALDGYPPVSASAPSMEPADSSMPDVTSLPPASSSEAPPATSSEAASSVEPSSVSSEPTSSSAEPLPVASASEQPSSAVSAEPPSSSPEASSETSSSEPTSSSSAEMRSVAPTTLTAVSPMPETLVFTASRTAGGPISLSGAVPSQDIADYLGTLAGAKADKLAVSADLPAGFAESATAGINALAQLADGRLGFDGSKWWLRGKVGQQAVIDSIGTAIAALPAGRDWSVGLDLLAPIEACRLRVDGLSTRNAIVFKSGTASLEDSSSATLDELAADLALCPKTFVHVQGHTDSDGDADGNLALSVARAETVVTELVKRGVDEGRLYAEGFGETDPIAPNDTREGKARNRRIAFELSEE